MVLNPAVQSQGFAVGQDTRPTHKEEVTLIYSNIRYVFAPCENHVLFFKHSC